MTINERVSPERLNTIKSWREKYGQDANVMIPASEAESIISELQQYRAAAEPAGYHVIKECGKVACSVATLEEAERTRDFWNKNWTIRPYFYAAPQVTSVPKAKALELAGWQFKSVNGDWLGLIGEHGKNQAIREGCIVREVFAMTDGINDREHVRREHAVWSQATFGNVGPVGPLKHLSKEALEAAAAPEDLSEWADMQFLLWDAQRRAGITDEQITQAMVEKLAVNKKREWPAPKDGEPRLHIAAPAVQAEQLSGNTEHVSQPYKLPEWLQQAHKLAELYGTSFVVFRHGEEAQCADPTKVIISFTDEGLGHHSAALKQEAPEVKK